MPPAKEREKRSGGNKDVSPRAKKVAKKKRGSDIATEMNNECSDSDNDDDSDREDGGTYVGGVYVPPPPIPHCSHEGSGPRLVITHITNENFKSYQGRQVLGPFHKSFTSIIGPNGSGKSNVIDSMLFVFGYRAKKIRSKKVSVLIHKSAKFQDIKSCTVAVHFAKINDLPGNDFELIPNSQLVIARTGFHDNSSKYTVNGKNKTFKEVTALLRSHGIDLKHNRFLILQGEVEQIALMKPKAQTEHETGILEYLEDIIGTSRYKKPIEKLNVKLEHANDECQEKVNRLRMVEKDKNALVGPVRDAVNYLKKDNEKTKARNKYHQCLIYDAKMEKDKLVDEKDELDKKVADMEKQLIELRKNFENSHKELNGKSKEKKILESELSKIKNKFRMSENRDAQLKEEISGTNKRRKSSLDSKKSLENKLADLKKKPEKLEKEVIELKQKRDRLQTQKAESGAQMQEVLQAIRESTKDLCDKRDQMQLELIKTRNSRDELRGQHDLAAAELKIYIESEKTEKEKLETYIQELKTVSEKLEQKKIETAELAKIVPEAENKMVNAKQKAESLRIEEEKIYNEMVSIRTELEEKSANNRKQQSRGKVLDFLLQKKKEGQLPGIFGRLGDLGGIDAKYDIAVSTACGPLDYIVVDSVQTGRNAVQLLKDFNVGRGNFIALEKVAYLRSEYMAPFSAPENVHRLFDLISTSDDKFKAAFYFSLRDTLVAKDLLQAKRVAYGSRRFRVVTLCGELIEVVGTMSGGGNVQMRGRMGRKSQVMNARETFDPSILVSLEARVAKLQEELQAIKESRVVAETEISELGRDLGKWRPDLKRFQMLITHTKAQEADLKERVERQKAQVASTVCDPKKIKEMELKVKNLKEKTEKGTEAVDAIQLEMDAINKEIDLASGNKIKQVQQKIDQTTKDLEKVNKDLSKSAAALKSVTREIKRAEEQIASLAKEISTCEDQLKKFQSERDKLTSSGSELNERTSKIEEDMKEINKVISDLSRSTSSMTKMETDIKKSQLEYQQTTELKAKEISEYKHIISQNKSKLAELKLHEIPKTGDEEDEEEEKNCSVDESMKDGNEEHDASQCDANSKKDPLLLRVYPNALLESMNKEQLKYKVTKLDDQLKSLKYNPSIIEEYKKKLALFKERQKETDEAMAKRNEVRQGYDSLRKSRLKEFITGFVIISNKLKEMYQMVTFGGDAEFELVDQLDPFAEGIFFSVRPPKKSWKVISNLSGGEKTLSSLALVFALHYYRPSPLYVMDEIDAALDFKNVSIIGHYIKERTRNSQFIIISLRSNMYELADVLVGIYKTYNCTKSVTITPAYYTALSNKKTAEKNGTSEAPAKEKLTRQMIASGYSITNALKK